MVARIILIFLITIAAAALTITLTVKDFRNNNIVSRASNSRDFVDDEIMVKVMPFKRTSRFLSEEKGNNNVPIRASDHCKNDNDKCVTDQGTNATCCNNKCIDLSTDQHNCGRCKKTCVYTDTCCRGECVNINYDKRHCGSCNNRCMPNGYCIYGLCDYA